MLLFVFKQKKVYEVRISDWSSDVCSSDLNPTIGDELQPAAMIPGMFDQIIVDDGIEPEFGGDQIEQVPDELPGILRTDQPTRGLREQCQPASKIGRASCRERGGQYV